MLHYSGAGAASQERWLTGSTADQTTSGTTALQIAALAIPAGDFARQPQTITARAALISTNPTATGLFTIRANGIFVASLTIGIAAGTGLIAVTWRHRGTDRSNTQVLEATHHRFNAAGSGTLTNGIIIDTAVDFTTAPQTVALSVTASNAGDSFLIKSVEMGRRG